MINQVKTGIVPANLVLLSYGRKFEKREGSLAICNLFQHCSPETLLKSLPLLQLA